MTRAQVLSLGIGTRVYCTVEAMKGWYFIVGIRPSDGFIKISGDSTWYPPHHFGLAGPT